MVFRFTVLCIDDQEAVKSKNIESLTYAFKANDTLWTGNINIEENMISSDNDSLNIEFENFDTSKFAVGKRYTPAYILTVRSNNYQKIEPFRLKLIDHLYEMKFSHIRILHDDISKDIACKIYPLIYSAENELREFITNSLVKKIGPEFWQYVVDKTTRDNANKHKNNEPHFIGSNKVVGDLMLLYFDALGKIAYGETTVFTQSNDILERVRSATNLEDLKNDLLEGNFQKHFKDCFEKGDFQKKWTRLNFFRNKVAHNSYFLHNDLVEAEKLIQDLGEIIRGAYQKFDLFKLSLSDMEALKKAVDDNLKEESESKPLKNDKEDASESAKNNIGEEFSNEDICVKNEFKSINEDILLEILKDISMKMPFVGLKHFVRDILGNQGYSYNSSYTLINILIDKGILKTEKEDNPNGEHGTTSIKFVN